MENPERWTFNIARKARFQILSRCQIPRIFSFSTLEPSSYNDYLVPLVQLQRYWKLCEENQYDHILQFLVQLCFVIWVVLFVIDIKDTAISTQLLDYNESQSY